MKKKLTHIATIAIFILTTLPIISCGGTNDNGDAGNGQNSANACGVSFALDEELRSFVAAGDLICGNYSERDMLVCFDSNGHLKVEIPYLKDFSIISLAWLGNGKIAVIGKMIINAPKGELMAIANINTKTISSPVKILEESTIWFTSAGLPNGKIATLDTGDGWLRIFAQDGTMISEAKLSVENINSGHKNGAITAVSNDMIALVSGNFAGHISILNLDGTIDHAFDNPLGSAPSTNLAFDGTKLHLLRGAFNGNGDTEHLYDDIYSISGVLDKTRQFSCDNAIYCHNRVMLNNGTVAAVCKTVISNDTLKYDLTFLK
jgi:hypothetical protein